MFTAAKKVNTSSRREIPTKLKKRLATQALDKGANTHKKEPLATLNTNSKAKCQIPKPKRFLSAKPEKSSATAEPLAHLKKLSKEIENTPVGKENQIVDFRELTPSRAIGKQVVSALPRNSSDFSKTETKKTQGLKAPTFLDKTRQRLDEDTNVCTQPSKRVKPSEKEGTSNQERAFNDD